MKTKQKKCLSKIKRISLLLVLIVVFILLIKYFPSIGDNTTTDEEEIELSDDKYLTAIQQGGEWFLNNQDDEFIYYEYYPFEQRHSTSSHALREMGALWSISKLSNYLDDERYVDLANNGIKYFEETFAYNEENDFLYVTVTSSKLKLGYNAFMILSLLETDYHQKDYYLEKLANGIMYMQNDDGSLNTFFFSNRSTGVDYYPGEALLALTEMYYYTGNETYIDVVEKAFPYYISYFWTNPNTAFPPWQSRAYYNMYQITKDDKYANYVFEMNDFMVEEHSDDCENFDFSRGIVTAVYMEGVIKAYLLAQELNETEKEECYYNFVKQGSDYILTLQITQEDNLNDHYEIHAIGGFLGSETSDSMKVDRNQHATMSLMDGIDARILS